MKILKKTLVAGGLALAVMVPVTAAFADGSQSGNGRGDGTHTCTYDQERDQDRDRLRLQDGTGWRHNADGTVTPGNGAGNQTGPMDGSGPRADRPLDGTGNQVRAGR